MYAYYTYIHTHTLRHNNILLKYAKLRETLIPIKKGNIVCVCYACYYSLNKFLSKQVKCTVMFITTALSGNKCMITEAFRMKKNAIKFIV